MPARLELKPAVGSSDEKEANHDNEEEEEEDGKAGSRKVTTQARASYWGPRCCVFATAGGRESDRYLRGAGMTGPFFLSVLGSY